MVFEVPKSKRDLPENRFEFTVDGETYSVPLMAYWPGWLVEKVAAAEQVGGMVAEAARFLPFGKPGTPTGDAVREMDREQFEALLDAYVEASKITAGESWASTDS